METLPDYLNSDCEMFNYQIYFKHNSFISAHIRNAKGIVIAMHIATEIISNPNNPPDNIPDDRIDFSDIPEIQITPWSYRGITGLFALHRDEQRKAISFLNRERAIREETPNALPTDPPARPLRYAREDMDASIRRCAAILDNNSVCNASYRVSDFPVGYYPFKEQVQSPTYANACSVCEIKADRRIAATTRDRHLGIALLDDADFLENHNNARMAGKAP